MLKMQIVKDMVKYVGLSLISYVDDAQFLFFMSSFKHDTTPCCQAKSPEPLCCRQLAQRAAELGEVPKIIKQRQMLLVLFVHRDFVVPQIWKKTCCILVERNNAPRASNSYLEIHWN